MAWIADLEEVLDLFGLQRNECPKCVAKYKDLGGSWTCKMQTGKDILRAQHKLWKKYPKATTWQFSVKISQWSGRENHDLQHHLAVVVAGAYQKGTVNESSRMMQATRSLLNFSYKAQLLAHSDISLQSTIDDLTFYYSSVRVFINNSARCNGKGTPIHHFRIPKHHNLHHFADDIRDHGTMDNGSSEIIEALHIPTFKVTYHATNQRAYTTQILDQLQHVDSLSIYSSILEAKGINQSQIDQATKGLSPPCMDANVSLITVSKHPQSVRMAVNAASSKFSTPDLASAMLRFFVYDCDMGLRHDPNRYYYASTMPLPPQISSIDIWHAFKLQRPPPNLFYPPLHMQVSCSPPGTRDCTAAYTGTTVLIRVNGTFQIGKARIISALPNDRELETMKKRQLYVFVHWFSPISNLIAHMHLRTVKKLISSDGIPDGGIVPLSSVVTPCPLAPVL
ncbi:uncharacterized protein EI90DRAFT_3020318 [Cantharellus anzutake]|uniref:uncharacterized protein n=1 Tax=Cantharellus anzutake TaxID=1750568 RepID=UPI001907C80E|nr:uncharacterized protein EI90DRAFT_3020318 [Cantharellus anzutake]KAF8321433.1 hypothetical protein EI90DRAFT_3020318 [Cantharellus anzutake]